VENLAETGIIYSDNNKENNDYFPTVEEILYTALHKEGFATENSEPNKTAQEIDEGSSRERNSSIDYRMSMPDDGLGTSESERAHYPSITPPFLLFLPLTLCR
jgi:hypothetical protein